VQRRPKTTLRAEMARLRITQQALSKYLDITDMTLRNWLDGKSAPDIDEAIAIWQYFKDRGLNMSLYELFS
jgi:DNA-binding XRE family transcriptional regulator